MPSGRFQAVAELCKTARMQHGFLLVACVLLGLGCGSDDRPAEWGYLHEAIVRPSCATVSCHTGRNAAGGIRLQDANEAYSSLTGLSCGSTEKPAGYVAPDDPANSRLIVILRGSDITMPPDRLLPIQDVQLFEEWIAGGALCE